MTSCHICPTRDSTTPPVGWRDTSVISCATGAPTHGRPDAEVSGPRTRRSRRSMSTGYAKRRSQVHPAHSRASTALSPYIRHGLITLAEAADAVGGAPAADRRKFVDELWWQEYTRHLYARVGTRNAAPLRRPPAIAAPPWPDAIRDDMVCLAERARRARTDRLAREPDPDVVGVALVRSGRSRLARWRGVDVSPSARRLAGGEPVRLAVVGRRDDLGGLRLLTLAGRATCAIAGAPRVRSHRIARSRNGPTSSPGEPIDDALLRRARISPDRTSQRSPQRPSRCG